MKRYRVCQIGCSPGRGRDHVRAFVLNADRFQVVGLCDRIEERLNGLGDEFAVAGRYPDAEQMLAEQKPDVLCFVTPPDIRLALVELGIRHGVKAIAYEKPMATNWPDACAIHRAVEAAGVKTIQSHQHKYGPHWTKARELIAAGEIGEVQEVRASSKGWMLHYASNGARAFHGFEAFMGACLSALDRRRVDLPFRADADILGRMRAELPTG